MAGLPYLQVRLYLVLRWYMDVATRRTGDVRGISLQGLCEELYVEPAPGRSESGSPSKKAVRSALQQLEKHGLIRPCGNGEVLVFFLPKSGVVSARQKTKGHKRGTGSGHAMGHGETQDLQGFDALNGHAMGQPQNPIKGHTSEVRVNHPYTQAVAAALAPVDKNLSTVPLLPVLTDEGIAEWLRAKEVARGCRARVLVNEVRRAGWAASGVTAEQLAEAYALAAMDREVANNPAPLNVAFIDIFVKRVCKGGLVPAGAAARTSGGASWVSAAAARLGVRGQQEGESDAEFVSRIGLEEEARGLGVVGLADGEPVVALMARIDSAKVARRRRA